ncbi:DnaJ-like protein DjlA [Vibrio aerogenes CECT 7868]|uniref:Co-chaperone protein DjlA n=1 Tax=Vibrio aerogenes CECT 7868 TaxID=1216006 RepID=A0A1M5YLB2_9VIBR|nr:co-chaperone DjlA [Vibrio aerogenes]SHI12836.1 DnaJ-like protein DjlA [Vibrio aerogenes CECT 7868]
MYIFGKILGVFFGLLFGGPFGALIGLFLGHQFDKARRLNSSPFSSSSFSSEEAQQARQEQFFKAAFSVMGHVAKAKGKVTKEEIHLATIMMERMNLTDAQKTAAQNAFRDGKSSDFPLDETLEQVLQATGRRHDLLQFFLELQISAAFADGDLHPTERNLLHKIAKGLGFSSEYLERRLRMQEAAFRFQRNARFGGASGGYQGSSGSAYQEQQTADRLDDAYKLLGIDKSADAGVVKKAYRKLMNEHHPDKLMAKGLPPEMMTVAKEKSQEIQQAYDLIKKAKGFK